VYVYSSSWESISELRSVISVWDLMVLSATQHRPVLYLSVPEGMESLVNLGVGYTKVFYLSAGINHLIATWPGVRLTAFGEALIVALLFKALFTKVQLTCMAFMPVW